ncbi:hypothetical protein ACJMK2_004425 [Sinanodonta woodiana]|uniref:Uncharacterized protein n=1 Tax=Sinanodonta woodiana TaxID=1069815 RepID=A0ABD3Y3C9_SINWO
MEQYTPATGFIPSQAFRAIMGTFDGLKIATRWSLRAAEEKTTCTFLLVMDREEFTQGNLNSRINRGNRRRNQRQCNPQVRDTSPLNGDRQEVIQTSGAVSANVLYATPATIPPLTQRVSEWDRNKPEIGTEKITSTLVPISTMPSLPPTPLPEAMEQKQAYSSQALDLSKDFALSTSEEEKEGEPAFKVVTPKKKKLDIPTHPHLR